MPRGKIDLQKVMAALNTTCTKCGRVIQSAEICRLNFTEMICPGCGEVFTPEKPIKKAG